MTPIAVPYSYIFSTNQSFILFQRSYNISKGLEKCRSKCSWGSQITTWFYW